MNRRQLKAQFFVANDGTCFKKAWPADMGRKRRVYERDKARCRYCDARLAWAIPRWSTVDGRQSFSVDHVVPRCRGGQNDLGNLVSACEPCNMRKGADILAPLPLNPRRRMPAGERCAYGKSGERLRR